MLPLYALLARFWVVLVANGFIFSNSTQQKLAAFFLEPPQMFLAHTHRQKAQLSGSARPYEHTLSCKLKSILQDDGNATTTNASTSSKLINCYSSATTHKIIKTYESSLTL